jgi:hypothetical protein
MLHTCFTVHIFDCVFIISVLIPTISGYPEYEGHFYVEADPIIHLWGNTLNEVRLRTRGDEEYLQKMASPFNFASHTVKAYIVYWSPLDE